MISAAATAPLRLRLILWIAVAGCWWLETATLADRAAACRHEHDRVQLIQQVVDLETSIRELESVLPESPAQDRTWWKQRFLERIHSQRMEVTQIEVGETPYTIGAYRLDRLSCTVLATYEQLVGLNVWLETLQPRVHTERLAVVPLPQGRLSASFAVLVPLSAGARR